MNSYSRHVVDAEGFTSSVPSTTTSWRTRVTLPNAPYVFTKWTVLKLAFMNCLRDSMFRTGQKLNTTTSAVTIVTITTYHSGPLL